MADSSKTEVDTAGTGGNTDMIIAETSMAVRTLQGRVKSDVNSIMLDIVEI